MFPVIDTFVAGENAMLLLRTIFKQEFLRVGSCWFCTTLTDFYLPYLDNFSFFGRRHYEFHEWRVFLFGSLVQVWRRLCFAMSVVHKMLSTLRPLLYYYKRLPNVTRKTREREILFHYALCNILLWILRLSFSENTKVISKTRFSIKTFKSRQILN